MAPGLGDPISSSSSSTTNYVINGGINIEKLDGVSNYNTWKFGVKNSLVLEGLWDSVLGTEKDTIKDAKALARISLSLKPTLYQILYGITTAKAAWEKLQSVFEDKGLFRRVSLLRQLHRVDYTQYENMTKYIEAIFTLVQQLADIGKVIEDEEIAEILLSGLPQEFDTLVSALETASMTNALSSELVRARLIQEEYRKVKTENQPSSSSSSALFAKNFNKKKIICSFCLRQGHVKARCFKLKRQKTEKNKKDAEQTVFASSFLATSQSTGLIVDSGSSSHMCNNANLLCNLKTNRIEITCADKGTKLESSGVGDMHVSINGFTKTLNNVLYVPQLSENLLSVSNLCNEGLVVVFKDDGCFIYDSCSIQGNHIMSANLCKGVYRLNSVSVKERSLVVSHSHIMQDADLWHRRLGHLSVRGMRLLGQDAARKITFQVDKDLTPCVACLEGKPVARAYPKGSTRRANQPLQLLHSDVSGPFKDLSWSDARYLLTLTDDFSRKSFGYLLKKKSDVLDCFIHFKNYVEKQTGLHIKCLRSDNGGEYCNDRFKRFLEKEGIAHQLTVPYCAQQNGVSERLNRTLIEKARCMLVQAGLCNRFWGEAVMTAIYLKNRSPTAALAGQVPEEVWSRHPVSLGHLRVFGCIAYSLIPEPTRTSKLNAKAKLCIFVGYSELTKGYRLIDPSNPRKVILSRNVHFIEDKFYKDFKCIDMNNPNNNKNIISISFHEYNNNLNCDNNEYYNDELNSNDNNNLNNSSQSIHNESQSNIDVDKSHNISCEFKDAESGNDCNAESSADQPEAQPASREDPAVGGEGATSTEQSVTVSGRPIRSTRGKPPVRFGDYEIGMYASSLFEEPQTYEDAIASSNSSEWQKAMEEEYHSLLQNKVWKLVDRPSDTNVVKCKWVYKLKHDTSGNFDRFKARLVARGFTQKEGIDYTDTFSPVVRHSTLRTLFSLAHHLDMSMEHIDVTTAFLNGDLNETIYMEQPKGFVCDESKVCMLQKSIYGLKQASRMWNIKVHILLSTNGFVQSKCEPCVYVKKNDKDLTIIALYVDDFYIFSTCNTKDLFDLLSVNFTVKHLGPITSCLGIRVVRNKNVLTLDQSEYIKRLLIRFKMSDCKHVSTPMIVNSKLEKSASEHLDDNIYQFRQLIGCLMYLSVCTRPDIAYSCSQLSQYLTAFDKSHWVAAKRILRYLAGTVNLGLCFYKSNALSIAAYTDADWGNDISDRKSYTGFVIKLGNSVVSWEARKQRCVALSSTEAEYLAIGDVTKELCFIRNFLMEILDKHLDIVIFNDNQSAHKLLLAKEYSHRRTKHIDIRYHFVKDLISKYNITVKYLPTEKMTADVLTKPISKAKLLYFLQDLNLKCL